MKQLLKLLIVMLLLTLTINAQNEPVFKTTQLSDQIYMLTSDEGAYTTNLLVFVGDNGLLLVDTNAEENADELKKMIDAFGKGIPKYIINTHRHVEHIGGNAVFGEAPVVIAHYLVPEKLTSGSYIFNEFPKETYPDITLTDSLTLYFNGEIIRMINMGGSHDDNEILVHFTKSKVVHLSSIVNGLNFPSVDSDGDIFKFPDMVKKAISLLPDDVTIVSGHNNTCTPADLPAYYDMLVNTKAIVEKGLAEGKDIKTMQEEKVFAAYELYNKSYVSIDEWIDYLAQSLGEQEAPKKKIYEPLYYALKDGGAAAAVDKYNELKNNNADEYDFQGVHLLIIGDKLLLKDKVDDAIGIFELSLKEFPDDKYNYYIYYELALAAQKMENNERAINYCNKSIELKEDFQAAAKLLEELK